MGEVTRWANGVVYEWAKGSVWKTSFQFASDILASRPTHIQIRADLIVPKELIDDFYASWDLVLFVDRSAEFVDAFCIPDLEHMLRERRIRERNERIPGHRGKGTSRGGERGRGAKDVQGRGKKGK